jgi:hypothetical protein
MSSTAPAIRAHVAVQPGRAHAPGAWPDGEGVNFSLCSRDAAAVNLPLFDVYRRQPLAALKSGCDRRLNPAKILIDPHGRGNTGSPRGWGKETDDSFATPTMPGAIISEMPVAGMRVSKNISWFQLPAVTAAEVQAIFECDHKAVIRIVDGKPLTKYWGYSTMSVFAPHSKSTRLAICSSITPMKGIMSVPVATSRTSITPTPLVVTSLLRTSQATWTRASWRSMAI